MYDDLVEFLESLDRRRLQSRVLDALNDLPGQALLEAFYWCFDFEMKDQVLFAREFYFGGEVELRFERSSLFLSWDEAGWEESHFSLGVMTKRFNSPDGLVRWSAVSTPHWESAVGRTLRGCSVYGHAPVPHAVVFEFDSNVIVVGTGEEEGELSDTDNVMVRSGRTVSEIECLSGIPTLWRSACWGP